MRFYITMSQARRAILACIRAGVVPMLWSKPGIGKTSLNRSIAKGKGFMPFRLNQRDQCDLIGVPKVDEKAGVTRWFPPEFVPQSGTGLWFFDELPQALPAMQNLASEPLLERTVAGRPLPEGWVMSAAGNFPEDGCATHRMPEHLKSRVCHLYLKCSLDDLLSWGNSDEDDEEECDFTPVLHPYRLGPIVQAFLKMRPDLLHKHNPADREAFTYPCSRTWEMTSKVLDAKPDKDITLALMCGCTGEEAGAAVAGFISIADSMIDPDACIANPKTAPVPEGQNQQAIRYALATSLGFRATPENFDSIDIYLKRLPGEFRAMSITTAVLRNDKLQHTKVYTQWVKETGNMIGMIGS